MDKLLTIPSHRPLLLFNEALSAMKFTHVIMRIGVSERCKADYKKIDSLSEKISEIQLISANNFVMFMVSIPAGGTLKENASEMWQEKSFLFEGEVFRENTNNLKSIAKSTKRRRKNMDQGIEVHLRDSVIEMIFPASPTSESPVLTMSLPFTMNDPPIPQIPDFSDASEILINAKMFSTNIHELMGEIVKFNVENEYLKISGEKDDSPSVKIKLENACIHNNEKTTRFYGPILKECISVLTKKDVFYRKKAKGITISFFKNGAAQLKREIPSSTYKSEATFILAAVREPDK